MKKLLLICLLILVFSGCKTSGTTYSLYTQESGIAAGRLVITGADGKNKGYLQQSLIDPRRTVQYDKKGNATGYWQKVPLIPERACFTRGNRLILFNRPI